MAEGMIDPNFATAIAPVLEKLNLEGEATGLEAERPEGAINAPFDPAKIDVITQARTVDLLDGRQLELPVRLLCPIFCTG